ncbi:MAG: hypothetical protein N4Q97_04345 [Lactobacillus iners]|nr:hypothetical protein [Lactobacillus iners]MCT7833855.1 hypothetical protein [Lactobacillus iners]
MVLVSILVVLEPQASGSWHLHGLIKKKNGKLPYLDNNSVIAPMWRQGFTKTKRLKDSDNVAAYLMAYLTDMPKDEIMPNVKSKSILKGARLHFYPSGVHIYSNSRGIKRPTNFKGFKGQVLKDLGLSEDITADATFNRKQKLKDGKRLIHITEFYDNIPDKKKTNYARQDND